MFIPVPSRLVLHEMEKMAVHPVGIQIMAPKAELCPVKLFQVKSPAANIIKQEMLSAKGAENLTVKGAINCSVPVGDVLLLGNKNQYRHLVEKLETMRAWFGFAEVIADLKAYLDETPLVTTLADGRQLTYEKMRVMGILNVTPDSFYAGSGNPGGNPASHGRQNAGGRSGYFGYRQNPPGLGRKPCPGGGNPPGDHGPWPAAESLSRGHSQRGYLPCAGQGGPGSWCGYD